MYESDIFYCQNCCYKIYLFYDQKIMFLEKMCWTSKLCFVLFVCFLQTVFVVLLPMIEITCQNNLSHINIYCQYIQVILATTTNTIVQNIVIDCKMS